MRGLESSVSSKSTLNSYRGGPINLFFSYDFSIANCMITNFHTQINTFDDGLSFVDLILLEKPMKKPSERI